MITLCSPFVKEKRKKLQIRWLRPAEGGKIKKQLKTKVFSCFCAGALAKKRPRAQMVPWDSIAPATFKNPAILAPAARLPLSPQAAEAS